jgi:hypothetical protein
LDPPLVTRSPIFRRPVAQWSGIVAIATILDLTARFGRPFDLTRVLRVEALLFPITGLLLLFLMQRGARLAGWRRGLQWTLIASFFLAGLRSALWALGIPVMVANGTLLVIAVLVLAVLVLRRWRFRRGKLARQ